MADDNPFDDAFGQFGDPNPPGTMTSMGLSPGDPLIDWGSNMKPADVARYVHDPEGFKNDMINSGQPPPSHDYVHGPSGLQPVDKSGNPIIRTNAQGRIQGNVSDYTPSSSFSSEPPPRPEDTAGKPSDRRQIPPTQTIPPSGPLAGPPATLGPPQGPLAPVVEKIKKILNPPAQAAPAPSTVPYGPPPPPGYGTSLDPEVPAPAAPQVPLPRPRPATATPATPEKEKKVEALSSEAMSDFAKSLQGVKAPTRPAWQPMGAPAVRSPVAMHPEIQSLLSAIGQGRPNLQQVALMRLLGRA